MSIVSLNINRNGNKLYESEKFSEFNNVYCFVRIPHNNHRHLKIAYGHFFNNDNDFIGYREDFNLMHDNVFSTTYYVYPYTYIVHDKDGKPVTYSDYDTAKSEQEYIINNLGYKYLYSRNSSISDIEEINVNYYTICKYTDGTEKKYNITGVLKSKSIETTNLESIYISETVTDIYDNFLSKIPTLKIIEIDSNNPIYDSRNNCNAIIETDTNSLIIGISTTVIPTTVTSISEYAFYKCENLYLLKLPNNIEILKANSIKNCNNLKMLIINENIKTIEKYSVLNNKNLQLVKMPNINQKYIFNNNNEKMIIKYYNTDSLDTNSIDSTDNLNNNSYGINIEI